jgi:hypothetical protein
VLADQNDDTLVSEATDEWDKITVPAHEHDRLPCVAKARHMLPTLTPQAGRHEQGAEKAVAEDAGALESQFTHRRAPRR